MSRSPAAKLIPARTQDRIFSAARELNYQPNMMAQSLRKQRSFTIGVMVPEISEGYSALVLSGIENYLLNEGYFFFVVSHRHRQKLLKEYPQLLIARAVEGVVAVDTPLNSSLRVPVVTISGHQKLANVTNIMLNHRLAAGLALGHLYDLGHRRIAIIKGQSFSSDTATRWKAIRHVAEQLRLELDSRLVVQLESDSFTSEPGYVATQALLKSGARFTSIFAFNDISAIGAIRAIREAGMRVPEDISVVGFDDVPSAAFQNPALTTIRQPLENMGMIAVQHLLQSIKERSANVASKAGAAKETSEVIVVEPQLIVRSSTAALAASSVSGGPLIAATRSAETAAPGSGFRT